MLEIQIKLASKLYKLVNTVTGERVQEWANLNASEAWTLNYAYATNGSPLRWQEIKGKS